MTKISSHHPITNIGKSVGNLNIPIVRISNEKNLPVIIVIGRQHSGETHSSFIIHGLINFLLSKNMMAHKLREVFDWWICPVVNPDGIICGNYRTNLQERT